MGVTERRKGQTVKHRTLPPSGGKKKREDEWLKHEVSEGAREGAEGGGNVSPPGHPSSESVRM